MKTHDEWMAETMQPIIDRIAGGPMDDKLALLHPSLGLAFTEMFHRPMGPPTIIQGNKTADQLPAGCDGCREEIGGRLICCVNQLDDE